MPPTPWGVNLGFYAEPVTWSLLRSRGDLRTGLRSIRNTYRSYAPGVPRSSDAPRWGRSSLLLDVFVACSLRGRRTLEGLLRVRRPSPHLGASGWRVPYVACRFLKESFTSLIDEF